MSTRQQDVALVLIRTDGGTQTRHQMDRETIHEYAEAMREGVTFPPIDLFYDGKQFWLADGFHRFYAGKEAELPVLPANVHDGQLRDAVLFSCGVNATHGLKRSNADKRSAVMKLLRDSEWCQWSNREVARQCAVHHTTVGTIREELHPHLANSPDSSVEESPDRTVQRGGTTYAMNTANIGRGGRATESETDGETFETDDPFRPLPAPQPQKLSEDELPEEDWLNTIPAWSQLSKRGHKGILFRRDALGYRYLRRACALSTLHHHAAKAINFKEGGATHFSKVIIEAAKLPHPRQWKICPHCKGNGCDNCGLAGYNMHTGIEVKP